MPTSKVQVKTMPTRERAAWVAAGVLSVGVLVVWLWSLRAPPQMGPDADVFNTVDALYTAVRNQDERRLGKCAKRLDTYREAGKLADAPARYLNEIIATARAGDWAAATRRLYEFMSVQRREAGKHGQRT